MNKAISNDRAIWLYGGMEYQAKNLGIPRLVKWSDATILRAWPVLVVTTMTLGDPRMWHSDAESCKRYGFEQNEFASEACPDLV